MVSDAPWHITTKAAISPLPSDQRCECRSCGAPATDPHHIVPKGSCEAGRFEVAQNLMPLCSRCHRGHHDGTVKIPQNLMTADELSFAIEEMGPAWVDSRYPHSPLLEPDVVPW